MVYLPSEGGLATGLGSIYKEGENVWVGWPGLAVWRAIDDGGPLGARFLGAV